MPFKLCGSFVDKHPFLVNAPEPGARLAGNGEKPRRNAKYAYLFATGSTEAIILKNERPAGGGRVGLVRKTGRLVS